MAQPHEEYTVVVPFHHPTGFSLAQGHTEFIIHNSVLEAGLPGLRRPADGSRVIDITLALCTPSFMAKIKVPNMLSDVLHSLFDHLRNVSRGRKDSFLFAGERRDMIENGCRHPHDLGIMAEKVMYLCYSLNRGNGLGWSESLLVDVLDFMDVLIPLLADVDYSSGKTLTRRTMMGFEDLLSRKERAPRAIELLRRLYNRLPNSLRELLKEDSTQRKNNRAQSGDGASSRSGYHNMFT